MENISIKRVKIAIGAFIAIIGLLYIQPFKINDSGYRTHVQQFDGHEFIQFSPGFYYAGFFAKTTEYPDVVTIQFEDEKDQQPDITYATDLITCQFSDGTYSEIGFNVKWQLPASDAAMLNIHKTYRGHARLACSLADYAKECMNYSTPIMDSERHYSGGKSELAEHFKFQLRQGQYVLEQREIVERDSSGNTRRMYQNFPKRDSAGMLLLTKSDVQQFKIIPTFVAITHVDYEEVVDKKLKAKVEQATAEAISKQSLMTAQQEALTAKALGDKMVAQAKAAADAEKETAVIQKQKEVELARLAAQQAKYDAERVRAEGDAKAAANQALVRAGLTPLERANIDMETKVRVAAEMAKIQFPQMMILGGDGKGVLDPFNAVGLKSFMDIHDRMTGGNK